MGPVFACVPNELRPQRIFSGSVDLNSTDINVCAGVCSKKLQVCVCLSVYTHVHTCPHPEMSEASDKVLCICMHMYVCLCAGV